MLKVVTNATPIISLLKIKKLGLLQDLYEQISVPQEVYREIEAGKEKEFYADLSKINWVKIEKIKNPKSFKNLDKGEAETITLANETEADLVILDEILGRYYAKNLGLNVTGTLGVLLKAKKNGFITDIKPFLYELKEKGIWLDTKLIKKVLRLADKNQ